MKVSLNWLKEFINFNIEPQKIANLLNSRTMEVEKIFPYFSQKKSFENIVVGEIKSITAHPGNDKFGIAEVYGGDTAGNKRIVFTKEGADIKVGDKPLIATKGAVFDHGLKIRDKAIFGIVSEAAFCSEKDLGINLNIPSIVKMPFEKIGRTAFDIFGLNDTVLEFDLEPNRPDLFGITGFAHELSAILNKDIILPELYEDIDFAPGGRYASESSILETEIENSDLVPSYIAIKISGIKIGESGQDIKNKLIKSGIRTINNIVDLTNIVMMETSQPLHAFDANSVAGGKIIVRNARKGEPVITLDGKERKLSDDDVVIADKDKIIALAGVMGGQNSEINKNTVDIIVESANFNMSAIRKTSRTLSLRTEASTRFEKGLHPSISITGIKRFIGLLRKSSGNINISCYAYQIKEFGSPKVYKLKYRELDEFAGDSAVKNGAPHVLSKLGYKILEKAGEPVLESESISVIPPYFRCDIDEIVNIYEDVLRIYGYDNIKSSLPSGMLYPPQKNLNFEAARFIKNLLSCAGFTEIITPSLTGEKELSTIINVADNMENNFLELKNPVSKDYSYFRLSLIPDILKSVSQNSKKYERTRIFEIGKIYMPEKLNDYPVTERNILCGAVCGGIKNKSREPEFYDGKGVVEFLLRELGIRKFSLNKIDRDKIFNENAALEVTVNKKRAGIFGEIKNKILEEFKIEYKVFILEIDLDMIKDFISHKRSFEQPNKYPEIEQDISIVVDPDIEYAAIEKIIKGFSPLIKNVRLADIYRGKQIEEGKISFLIRYDAMESSRTLTMEEVNSLRDNLIKELNLRFGITLRN